MSATNQNLPDTNPDPLTGETGAHPLATGIGAAAAGAAGLAVAAAVAGPVGAAVATAGSAFVGGYVGKALGELLDPTAEDAFWREEHSKQPYATQEIGFDDYLTAYRTGYEGYRQDSGAELSFDDEEPVLRAAYQGTGARLPWLNARFAARAAWNRVHDSRMNARRPGPAAEERSPEPPAKAAC